MTNARKTMKVAMMEQIGSHGGMDYYDYGLCAGLIKAGCRITLYTSDMKNTSALEGLEIKTVFKGIFGTGKFWLRTAKYLLACMRMLVSAIFRGCRLCHYHVFHGNLAEIGQLVLFKVTMRKIVLTVHDVESFEKSPFPPKVIGHFYNYAHVLIVHNRLSRDEIVEKLGVSPEKIRVIPHGNYLHMMEKVPDADEAKRRLRIDGNKKVVLFFGQIKDVKGLDLLLRAMPSTIAEKPDTVLLIAGRPWKTDFSSYENLIGELGIQANCVSHIRYIPNDEVPTYFAACDVVVIPYRRIYQSGVVLMAQSYGRCVLVSDIPGMLEIVRDGQNGFVFKNGDADDLSRKLLEILSDDSSRNRVAANGLRYVSENHDWDKVGVRTAEIYKELLA